MLVCPKCQFENPDNHRFCQQCGRVLVHHICGECGAKVALSQLNCPECGIEVGTVRWAIVQRKHWQSETLDDRADNKAFPKRSLYLDSQHRYQILPPISPTQVMQAPHLEARVLDCQPFQISPLHAKLEAVAEMADVADIPPLAHPYLTVASELVAIVPPLHDAWQGEERQVILVEDRSTWSSLSQQWEKRGISLAWFDGMARAWERLAAMGYARTLLEEDNLKVSPHGEFGLQSLYANEGDRPPTLADLGKLWYRLAQSATSEGIDGATEIFEDIANGTIQSLAEARSRLEAAVGMDVPTPTDEDGETTLALEPITDSQETDPLPDRPVQLLELQDAGRTDIGRRRSHNEDTFGIWTQRDRVETPSEQTLSAKGLYVLCDGMGGHDGGEVASHLALETLRDYFQESWGESLPDENSIIEAIHLANQKIYECNQSQERSGSRRMGTTLVMLLVQDTRACVAHVGDSRLYRFDRTSGLQQITTDHEVGQLQIRRGMEPDAAYGIPGAYQLTQALGPRDTSGISPEVQWLDLGEDTLFVMASDGLTDRELVETHCSDRLNDLLDGAIALDAGANQFVDLANEHNGHDNITVVLVRVTVQLKPDPPESTDSTS